MAYADFVDVFESRKSKNLKENTEKNINENVSMIKYEEKGIIKKIIKRIKRLIGWE